MGGALLRGMLKAGAVSPEEVWVYDHHHENVQALQQEYPGVHEAATEADAADAVEALILAVKPHGVLFPHFLPFRTGGGAAAVDLHRCCHLPG